MIWRQARPARANHPGRHPLADGLRVGLIRHAVLLLLVGGLRFGWPTVLAPWWIWALTPLTARMIGAWLFGAGLILIHALIEDNRRRVRNGLTIYGVFSLLQLVALGRYWQAVTWLNPLRPNQRLNYPRSGNPLGAKTHENKAVLRENSCDFVDGLHPTS